MRAALSHTLIGVDARERQAGAIQEAEQYLEKIAARVRERGFVYETAVPRGHPTECIVDQARTRQADLIVMTTHGRTGPGRWIFGSVTESVVANSPVPVLVQRAWQPLFGEPLWSERPELLVDARRIGIRRDRAGTSRESGGAVQGRLVLVRVGDEPSVIGACAGLPCGGKIEVTGRCSVRTSEDLSMVYTPGVARVCLAIRDDPAEQWKLTIKPHTIAVVTDGSAVLGLGNIGPAAAQPVIEGTCLIFKAFAGVDAFPQCLATQDTDEIVETVRRIAPVFGGINLEDIAAPRCFGVENRLQRELDIPVMHDDQHGTAIVVLAALRNAQARSPPAGRALYARPCALRGLLAASRSG